MRALPSRIHEKKREPLEHLHGHLVELPQPIRGREAEAEETTMPGPACRYCGESLPAGAVLCRGCGATLARRPVSVWPLFLFLPLIALAAVLGYAVRMELPLSSIAIAFPLAWLALALAYFAWTRRATWRRGQTLLLTSPVGAAATRCWSTLLTSQWSMGATTAAFVGALWIASSGQPLDPAHAVVLPLDGSERRLASASVPVPALPAGTLAKRPASISPPAAAAPAASVAAVPAVTEPRPTVAVARNEEPAVQPTVANSATVAVPVDPAPAPPAEGELSADEQAVVLAAQKMLDGLGYSVGGIDGKAGSKTRVAVRNFRDRLGLGGGETIDTALVAALERATAQRQAAIRQARQQQAPDRTSDPAAAVAVPTPVNASSSTTAEPLRLHRVSDPASPSAPLRLRRDSSAARTSGMQPAPIQSARASASSDPIGF
jgi:peptidoglycan hydrolase-like protein with peptidoglycan-binding domain/ribosomal protein L40E